MTDIFFPGGTHLSYIEEQVMQHRRRMFKSMRRKNTGRKTREWAERMGIKHVHSIGWGCYDGCTDGFTPPVRDPGEKRPFGMKVKPENTISQKKSQQGKQKTRMVLESRRRMDKESRNARH